MGALRWQVPQSPSARLTHGLKPLSVVWLLRCSVLRETPMAFFYDYFKKRNCYHHSTFNSAVWQAVLR
jgi:hypothetical protein